MGGVPQSAGVRTGDVVWYLSAGLSDAERMLVAESSDGAVFRGEPGVEAAVRLRKLGYSGRLWIDPVAYEWPQVSHHPELFGDRWLDRQVNLKVTEIVSPGSYVFAGHADQLRRAVEREAQWLEMAGTGRVSLVVEARWLTQDVELLAAVLEDLGKPVALALAHRNDPLSLVGAVDGLVSLVERVADVAVLRCDLGALGAMAHGAALGAIGTSSAVRHVVPRGRSAGGVPGDRSPSVFVAEFLDFRLGSFLDELPMAASPVCELDGCDGAALRRFNDEHMAKQALLHNLHAIRHAVARIAGAAPSRRAQVFNQMCLDAEYAIEELAIRARRPLSVRPQVSAWARLRRGR